MYQVKGGKFANRQYGLGGAVVAKMMSHVAILASFL